MSAIAAPPPWVLALPLDPGSWRLLVALWTFADFGSTGAQAVWPGLASLRQRAGNVKPAALYKQLGKLETLGWIRDHDGDEGGWMLAWESPFPAKSPSVHEESPSGDGTGGEKKSPSVESQVSKCATKSLHLENPSKEDLAGDLAHDLAGPRSAGGADCVGREPDAISGPDPRQAQHEAIREQQRRLQTEREETRKQTASDPVLAITREYHDAICEAGPLWAREADRGDRKWLSHLADAIQSLNLKPDQVCAVLRAWDREAAALGGPLEVAKLDRFKGTMPQRQGVWWPSWRGWVARQLAPDSEPKREAGSARTDTPLSCAWPKGTPRVVSFTERRKRKALASSS